MQVKGITDEITNCDCCGRTGLKRTVALEADGEIFYYGVTCAARATGRQGAAIEREAVAAQRTVDHAAARALELQARASEILLVAHETGEAPAMAAPSEPLRQTYFSLGGGLSYPEWLHQVAERGAF